MQDVFFEDKYKYTTPLNPVAEYLKQLSFYIQTSRNVSSEKAKEIAIALIKKNFKDKNIKCFEREENGDRVVKNSTLMGYIKSNLKESNILTPTFTSYMSRQRRPSVLSDFIFHSVAKRAKAKKEAHVAEAEGNLVLADNKNNEQNNLKTYNNSMSGAFAQAACILFNPSNHSTLTSITRTMTSMCNANNERIIAGNRYYPRGIDVFNNIIYIAANSNEAKIKEAVDKLGLHIPTVEETVRVLRRSSDLYFHDRNYYQTKIIPYLSKLSPYLLASICYTGDLYHLRIFNDSKLREILTGLIKRYDTDVQDPEILSKLAGIDESVLFAVHHMFYADLRGKGKDYSKMLGTGIPESVYLTSVKFIEKVNNNKLFFSTFFMSPVMPVNSFRLKNMMRRTVVLSDTDSTCFTLDEWVSWFNGGEFKITPESVSLCGVMCYTITQVIIHLLRLLSRNLNVDKELIDRLGMKNEFLWLAHVPADISKHYFAYTVLKEGAVHKEPDIEIKGVHLKNSTVPKFVIDDAKKVMREIVESVSNNKKVSFNKVCSNIIKLEQDITASVLKGESIFLKRSKIQTADSYSLDETKSPYARHTFWNSVFGPTYGMFDPPPYGVIKIPTILQTKTAVKTWLSNMENRELSARLLDYFEITGKTKLPTIYMNSTYVSGYGIPKEILEIANMSRIILDTTKQHRIILQTLGVIIYKDQLIQHQFAIV